MRKPRLLVWVGVIAITGSLAGCILPPPRDHGRGPGGPGDGRYDQGGPGPGGPGGRWDNDDRRGPPPGGGGRY